MRLDAYVSETIIIRIAFRKQTREQDKLNNGTSHL
jgi:hypothetical protein